MPGLLSGNSKEFWFSPISGEAFRTLVDDQRESVRSFPANMASELLRNTRNPLKESEQARRLSQCGIAARSIPEPSQA